MDITPSLQRALSEALAVTFVAPQQLRGQDRAIGASQAELSEPQERQLMEMVQRALSEGLFGSCVPGSWTIHGFKRYDDGNTAQAVFRIPLRLEFVAKWDTDEKLLREAAWLQSVATRSDLPEQVRRLVPRVFAVRRGEETHAYLMEVFPEPEYRTLARALFEERSNEPFCTRMISASLDALFTAYDATASGEHHPLLPDIRTIYVSRIRDRLFGANVPEELAELRESELILSSGNDLTGTPSCANMLDELEDLWPKVEAALTPRFVTMVFGDPHPGNIMIRSDHRGVHDVHIIDPKEWGEGDYLFDLAKFIHYLEVTWLVEVLPPPPVQLSRPSPGRMKLVYELPIPAWLRHARSDALGRVGGLLEAWAKRDGASATNGAADPEWRTRLSLGLASNLLGVAASRYRAAAERCGPACRRIIFAEGARWLFDFLQSARRIVGSKV